MTEPRENWLTPEQLAEQMGMSARWVKDQMALHDSTSGARGLPSVKVGGRRFWTPGCMTELEARHLAAKTEAQGWGRKTKRGAA